jgi:hypothetical protein
MNTPINPENDKEAENASHTGSYLVSEETQNVTVEPGEINDESDGRPETDYLGRSNKRNRES